MSNEIKRIMNPNLQQQVEFTHSMSLFLVGVEVPADVSVYKDINTL